MQIVPSSRVVRRLGIGFVLALCVGATLAAQIPGRNVNMVAGTEWPGGDPFLQRQNEPSIAASTRNPLHLVGGSNDYRTVDLPGLPNEVETGDAWLERLQVVRRRPALDQHADPRLSAGHVGGGTRLAAARAIRRQPIRWCAPAPAA